MNESQAFLVDYDLGSLEEFWLKSLQNHHLIQVYLNFFIRLVWGYTVLARIAERLSHHMSGGLPIHCGSLTVLAFVACLRLCLPGFSTVKSLFFSLVFSYESLCLKGGGIKCHFLEETTKYVSFLFSFSQQLTRQRLCI